VNILKEIAVDIDSNNDEEIRKALRSCIGTKFASRSINENNIFFLLCINDIY
jgi:hypothetical protein